MALLSGVRDLEETSRLTSPGTPCAPRDKKLEPSQPAQHAFVCAQ